MKWRRGVAEIEGARREVWFLHDSRIRLGLARSAEYGDAWIIFGFRDDNSTFVVVSSHEIIEDVKREAENMI